MGLFDEPSRQAEPPARAGCIVLPGFAAAGFRASTHALPLGLVWCCAMTGAFRMSQSARSKARYAAKGLQVLQCGWGRFGAFSAGAVPSSNGSGSFADGQPSTPLALPRDAKGPQKAIGLRSTFRNHVLNFNNQKDTRAGVRASGASMPHSSKKLWRLCFWRTNRPQRVDFQLFLLRLWLVADDHCEGVAALHTAC